PARRRRRLHTPRRCCVGWHPRNASRRRPAVRKTRAHLPPGLLPGQRRLPRRPARSVHRLRPFAPDYARRRPRQRHVLVDPAHASKRQNTSHAGRRCAGASADAGRCVRHDPRAASTRRPDRPSTCRELVAGNASCGASRSGLCELVGWRARREALAGTGLVGRRGPPHHRRGPRLAWTHLVTYSTIEWSTMEEPNTTPPADVLLAALRNS